MATIVYYEGSDVAVNLENVISFSKGATNEHNPKSAVFWIGFSVVTKGVNSHVWNFKTQEQRDSVFFNLLKGSNGILFNSSGELEDGNLFGGSTRL